MVSRPIVSAAAAGLLAAAVVTTGAAGHPPLTRADVRWLNRVTFGIDQSSVSRYQELGREKFLDEQLHSPAADSAALAAEIAANPVTHMSAAERIAANRTEQQRINSLPSDEEKQKARTALNQAANDVLYQTTKRHLMRALRSPSQLREQMTWFWMNHFNVFQGKANVRWTLADYEEHAIRAHALGSFRELVLATATAPAMLEYLDNAQSSSGRINENYARELMELHTLGVSGGVSGSRYTQTDVQELARVLTGVGINFTDTEPKLGPELRAQYVHRGLFEFNPARHDRAAKIVLGETIHSGQGLDEIERAIALLCRQPATARYISRKLAVYFVTDDPPEPLVDRMTATFQSTDGSIAAVLRTMFLDKLFQSSLAEPRPRLDKFKDPLQYVVSSLRLTYDGKTIANYRPVVGWLQQLGEPLYGRVTPDGYPLTAPAWTSSGQMVRRFEVARAIGSGNAGLFNDDENKPGTTTGFPVVTTRLFYDQIASTLTEQTRTALDHTTSQQEWNTMLLASPEWMSR